MGKEKSKKGEKGSKSRRSAKDTPMLVDALASKKKASTAPMSEEVPRLEDRRRYETPLTFRSYSGVEFHGITTDVSLSGAFLHIGAKPLGIKVGDEGVVVLQIKNDEQEYEMTFSCAIARVTANGLGLSFELPENTN